MQAIASIQFADPIYGLIAAALFGALAGAMLVRSISRFGRSGNPLSGLFNTPQFDAEANAVTRTSTSVFAKSNERRVALRHPHSTVLRGRIDHLNQVSNIWGPETRDEAIAQVAQVMRSGLRKNDTMIEADGPAGDTSFIILARGASEDEASCIAKRLLDRIAATEVNGMSAGFGLTASFGIAARRPDETVNEWHARAGSALDAAQSSGEDRVFTATEWEEVALLPSPAASQSLSEERAKVA